MLTTLFLCAAWATTFEAPAVPDDSLDEALAQMASETSSRVLVATHHPDLADRFRALDRERDDVDWVVVPLHPGMSLEQALDSRALRCGVEISAQTEGWWSVRRTDACAPLAGIYEAPVSVGPVEPYLETYARRPYGPVPGSRMYDRGSVMVGGGALMIVGGAAIGAWRPGGAILLTAGVLGVMSGTPMMAAGSFIAGRSLVEHGYELRTGLGAAAVAGVVASPLLVIAGANDGRPDLVLAGVGCFGFGIVGGMLQHRENNFALTQPRMVDLRAHPVIGPNTAGVGISGRW